MKVFLDPKDACVYTQYWVVCMLSSFREECGVYYSVASLG